MKGFFLRQNGDEKYLVVDIGIFGGRKKKIKGVFFLKKNGMALISLQRI